MSHPSPSQQPQTKKSEIIPQYIHDLKAELMAHTDTSIASLASMILKNMATKEGLAETNAELRAFKIETNKNFVKVNAEIKKVNAKIDDVESRMATKENFIKVDTRLNDVESRMATKNDLKNFAIEYDLKNVATKKDLVDHMQVFTKLWQSGDVRITRLEKEVFDIGR